MVIIFAQEKTKDKEKFFVCPVYAFASPYLVKKELESEEGVRILHNGKLFQRGMQVRVTVDIPARGITKGVYILSVLKEDTQGKLTDSKGKTYSISQNDSQKIFPSLELV